MASPFKIIPIGEHNLVGYKTANTRFGTKKIIALEVHGVETNREVVWSTPKLNGSLNTLLEQHKLPMQWGLTKEIKINVTGFGEIKGNPFPYFRLWYKEEKPLTYEPEPEDKSEKAKSLPTTPLGERKLWKDILYLSGLPLHTILQQESSYGIQKYKKCYPVIVVGRNHYCAGEFLDCTQLFADTKIRLCKTKNGTTSSNKAKQRERVLFQEGEWWSLVDKSAYGKKVLPKTEDVADVKRIDGKTVLALLKDNSIVNLLKGPLFDKAIAEEEKQRPTEDEQKRKPTEEEKQKPTEEEKQKPENTKTMATLFGEVKRQPIPRQRSTKAVEKQKPIPRKRSLFEVQKTNRGDNRCRGKKTTDQRNVVRKAGGNIVRNMGAFRCPRKTT